MKISFEYFSQGPLGELKVEVIRLERWDNQDAEITVYVNSEELEEFAFIITEKSSQ